MKERIIGRRYAKGLVELAVESGETDRLFKDMIAVREIVAEVPHFVKALSDERIRLSNRFSTARKIIKALGLSKYSGDAILLLIQNGRVAVLPYMANGIISNLRLRKKLTIAHAQVADRCVGEDVQSRIEKILTRIVGMEVECEVNIDPSLVGGFVVEVGDFRFDASIKGKLTRMKEEFFQ